jgi:hypothetical protein
VEPSKLAFEQTLSTLLGKGYRLRVFWTPVVRAVRADRRTPTFMADAVASVGEIAGRLGIEDYSPARFDPFTFGCTERDYLDAWHVDADCLRRFFRIAFDSGDWPDATYTRRHFERQRAVYQGALERARPAKGAGSK